MCAGCGGRFAKEALVRFTVVGDTGETDRITIDGGGKSSGRGAYICRRLECFDTATGKRRSLQRRLKAAPLEPGLRDGFIALLQEDPEA